MRLNLKLTIAGCCVIAAIIILWRTFGIPIATPPLPIRPTIAIVGEPAAQRPTLAVPTQPLGSTASQIPLTPILASPVVTATSEQPTPSLVVPTAADSLAPAATNSVVQSITPALPVPTLSPAPPIAITQAVPAASLVATTTLPTNEPSPTGMPTASATTVATVVVSSTLTILPSATASATVTPTASATATPASGIVALTLRVEVVGVRVPLAEIAYTIGSVRYALGRQATPWSITISVDRSQPVLLQSRNLSDTGTLRCGITIDNQSTPANVNESDDPEILLECSVFDDQ